MDALSCAMLGSLHILHIDTVIIICMSLYCSSAGICQCSHQRHRQQTNLLLVIVRIPNRLNSPRNKRGRNCQSVLRCLFWLESSSSTSSHLPPPPPHLLLPPPPPPLYTVCFLDFSATSYRPFKFQCAKCCLHAHSLLASPSFNLERVAMALLIQPAGPVPSRPLVGLDPK